MMFPIFFSRAGHDSLGAELINVLSDRTSVAHKLLHLSLLRLSKHIYFGGVDGESCPESEAKVMKIFRSRNL